MMLPLAPTSHPHPQSNAEKEQEDAAPILQCPRCANGIMSLISVNLEWEKIERMFVCAGVTPQISATQTHEEQVS